MRPFTVLIGIVLGSAASITFGLSAVLIVFCVLAGTDPVLWRERPDLGRELPRLVESLLAFGVLTAASAGSFLGQAKGRPWRAWAHLATVAALCAIVAWYWPRRA
jgi:amino acid transporter